MFKVIETAGHDEPWWFFEDWEKMIVSTEEFDEIEEALCAYQALYQNFEDGVYLYKNLEVLKIAEDFEKTQALSDEVTLESLSKMPVSHCLGGYLFSLIGPLM